MNDSTLSWLDQALVDYNLVIMISRQTARKNYKAQGQTEIFFHLPHNEQTKKKKKKYVCRDSAV